MPRSLRPPTNYFKPEILFLLVQSSRLPEDCCPYSLVRESQVEAS